MRHKSPTNANIFQTMLLLIYSFIKKRLDLVGIRTLYRKNFSYFKKFKIKNIKNETSESHAFFDGNGKRSNAGRVHGFLGVRINSG